jgi:hypothetical protein
MIVAGDLNYTCQSMDIHNPLVSLPALSLIIFNVMVLIRNSIIKR